MGSLRVVLVLTPSLDAGWSPELESVVTATRDPRPVVDLPVTVTVRT